MEGKRLYEIASIIAIGMVGSIIYDKWVGPWLTNAGILPLTKSGVTYGTYPSWGGLNS